MTVAVAVLDAVAVAVGVGVGVGLFFLLAEPASSTLADRLPTVASLVIVITPEKVPELAGANSTVTVDCPCGWIIVVPCPAVMSKHLLPFGGWTVTVSALKPPFVMVKDFFSTAAAFANSPFSSGKFRMLFESSSLLSNP